MLSASHVRLRNFEPRPWVGSWSFFWWVSGTLLVADQLSKLWAVCRLTNAMDALPPQASWTDVLAQFWHVGHPLHRASVAVIDSCFHFRYVQNPGAAWGFLAGASSAWRTPFFLVLSLSAMAFILIYLARLPVGHKLLRVGLTLVFGGALGNFIDRMRLGYVIDFIDWHVGDIYTWPTFNVADAGITVGVILLVLDTLFENRRG